MAVQSRNVPLHVQLKERFLRDLENGLIRPGDTLPSERALENQWNVSRITVRRVLNDLANAGYLQRKPGSGTTVVSTTVHRRSAKIAGIYDDARAQGLILQSDLLYAETTPAPFLVARRLRIGPKERVFHTRKLVRVGDLPLAIADSYLDLPDEVRLTEEDLEQGSVFNTLAAKYGFVFSDSERTISATLPSSDEASVLQIPQSLPLLCVEMIVNLETGKPFSVVESRYRSDMYRYSHSALNL
ncbi:MAG: GntR family transcriptional regulator [Trueperaceae bacterium]|nr:GntR family transcriptional regulator [Trueperaceae bacterium]